MSAAKPGWMRQQERSNLVMLRLMVWLSLRFGRPAGRVMLHGIALYFTLFSPAARRASRAYLARALGRRPRWRDGYRQVLAFATTIHDRLYLLNDRFDLFDIEIVGAEALHAAHARQPGVLLMGAHLGSFEVLRAAARQHPDFRVAMLMYEDNARKLNAVLHAINPAASQDIIPLGRMESMLEARDRLEAGCFVGMLADRSLVDDATVRLPLLGAAAPFPRGPWRLAAMLKRPVFFMTGLYLGGNRYQLHFVPLADFSATARGDREAAMDAAMRNYADCLTRFCKQAPYNWFNFFDFWRDT